MKYHSKTLKAALLCAVIPALCLGLIFLEKRLVTASEESTDNKTRTEGENKARKAVIDGLKFECDKLLDVNGKTIKIYELTDYKIENLKCEADPKCVEDGNHDCWDCYADGRGTCELRKFKKEE